ncbi:MAG: hypothetical protein ACREDL_23035 [Bradyrhizobium sp.]
MIVAVAVGVLETLNLIAEGFALSSGLWRWIDNLNGNFGTLGCLIVLASIACWGISAAVYRCSRFVGIKSEIGDTAH